MIFACYRQRTCHLRNDSIAMISRSDQPHWLSEAVKSLLLLAFRRQVGGVCLLLSAPLVRGPVSQIAPMITLPSPSLTPRLMSRAPTWRLPFCWQLGLSALSPSSSNCPLAQFWSLQVALPCPALLLSVQASLVSFQSLSSCPCLYWLG